MPPGIDAYFLEIPGALRGCEGLPELALTARALQPVESRDGTCSGLWVGSYVGVGYRGCDRVVVALGSS